MLPYAALFLLLLAGEIGLFDQSSNDAPDPPEPPEPPPETPAGDLYDAAAYTGRIDGTAGNDTLTATGSNLAWFLQAGDDELDASDHNDFADAGAGDDFLLMRDGNDIALGGDGNDTIDGGIGFDLVYGEAGDDSLTGNGGQDTLFGGIGADTMLGGTGDDLLYGGVGDDYLSGMGFDLATSPTQGLDGIDTLFGGDGDDTILLGPRDIATGGAGADLFRFDDTRPELTSPARVLDFNATEDEIELLYLPQTDATGQPIIPQIRVAQDATGAYEVRVGDRLVGFVNSTGTLSADMIRLVPRG